MALTSMRPSKAVAKALAFAGLSLALFYAYLLALAWVPLFAPAPMFRLLGFHAYMGLLAVLAALITGFAFRFMFVFLFPRRPWLWAMSSSALIATIYLALAYWSEAAGGQALWWIPVMEALLLLVLLPALCVRRATQKNAPANAI